MSGIRTRVGVADCLPFSRCKCLASWRCELREIGEAPGRSVSRRGWSLRGPPEVFYDTTAICRGFTSDEDHVYATFIVDGEVVQIPKSGVEAVVLDEAQSGPRQIVQDGACVYWLSSYHVMRAPKRLP